MAEGAGGDTGAARAYARFHLLSCRKQPADERCQLSGESDRDTANHNVQGAVSTDAGAGSEPEAAKGNDRFAGGIDRSWNRRSGAGSTRAAQEGSERAKHGGTVGQWSVVGGQ